MKSLDTKLKELARLRNTQSLLAREEIVELTERDVRNDSASPEFSNPQNNNSIRFILMSSIILGALGLSTWLFLMPHTQSTDNNSLNSKQLQSAATPEISLATASTQESQLSPSLAANSNNEDKTPRKKLVAKKPQVLAPEVHKVEPGFQVSISTDVQIPDASIQAPPRAHPPIAAVQSIELTLKELKELGIAYNQSEITLAFERRIDLDEMAKDNSAKGQAQLQQLRQTLHDKGYPENSGQVIVRYLQSAGMNGTEGHDILDYGGWSMSKADPLCPVGYSSIGYNYYRPDSTSPFKAASHMAMEMIENESPALSGVHIKPITEGTFAHGRSKDSIRWDLDEIRTALTTKALPVKVTLSNWDEICAKARMAGTRPDSSDLRTVELSIWFVPQSDFILRLPERYKNPLMREFHIYERVIAGEVRGENACAELSTPESYMGFCRSYAADLQFLNVYPNPAQSHVKCVFELNRASLVHFDLYSLDGQFLSELQANQSNFARGRNEADVELGKVSSGLYMLMLSDDHGTQVIQRLLVR